MSDKAEVPDKSKTSDKLEKFSPAETLFLIVSFLVRG
jgi:hypothetical protein